MLGRWLPFHTLAVAALRHSRARKALFLIVNRWIFGLWKSIALVYSQPLCSGLTRWRSCRGDPLGLGRRWSGDFGDRCLPWRKAEKGEGSSCLIVGNLGSIPPPKPKRKKEKREDGLFGIAGTPFSRYLQKGRQNPRERRADHLYITKKLWVIDWTLGDATKAGNPLRKYAVDLDLVG